MSKEKEQGCVQICLPHFPLDKEASYYHYRNIRTKEFAAKMK
jgi:hypothetical protein